MVALSQPKEIFFEKDLVCFEKSLKKLKSNKNKYYSAFKSICGGGSALSAGIVEYTDCIFAGE